MNNSSECAIKSLLPMWNFSTINCVSKTIKPHIRNNPRYNWAWYNNVERKKMFANKSKIVKFEKLMRVPPK